jgi:hypothetical protein
MMNRFLLVVALVGGSMLAGQFAQTDMTAKAAVGMKMMAAAPAMSAAKTNADAFDVWQGFVGSQLGTR